MLRQYEDFGQLHDLRKIIPIIVRFLIDFNIDKIYQESLIDRYIRSIIISGNKCLRCRTSLIYRGPENTAKHTDRLMMVMMADGLMGG